MASTYFDVEHGTDAWRNWRAGKIGCSKLLHVMATGRGTPWGQAAVTYADQLAVEIITGQPMGDEMDAPALKWGRHWEPTAREEYILARTVHVEKVQRVYYREGYFVGGSPDGLINPNGGMEIKCPKDPRVHFETVINKGMPIHHAPQVMGYMWLTDREWWDFVSFDPRFPEASRLFVQRIHRNDQYIAQLSLRVQQFQGLVIEKLKRFGYEGDPYSIAPPVAMDAPPVEEAQG